MNKNIVIGIKYGTRVSGDDKHGWHASVTKAKNHTYGKHTAFGARTVMRIYAWIAVKPTPEQCLYGEGLVFKTRADAKAAVVARRDAIVAERREETKEFRQIQGELAATPAV